MTGYVRNLTLEVEFDGEKVAASVKPLLFEDALLVKAGGNEEGMLVAYAKMLPRYIVNLSPIRAADGTEVPIDEIVTVTYFAPLVSKLLRQHFDASKPANPTLPGDPSGD